LKNIIEYSSIADNHGNGRQKAYPTESVQSMNNNLNTLALQTMIAQSQAGDAFNSVKKAIIKANGTWQSISKWGKNEGLDKEQQTAFEILAAMHVLSLYDDMIVEDSNLEDYEAFIERKNGSGKLARQNMDTEEPLCIFITGPAGAGKCKSRRMKPH
jgi:hypothetical protein